MASPYIVSTPLPSVTVVQSEIDALMEEIRKLAAPPVAAPQSPFIGLGPGPAQQGNPFGFMGLGTGIEKRSLESRLAQKQKLLDSLLHPADTASKGAAVLAPRIESPKVGFSALKIPLPR